MSKLNNIYKEFKKSKGISAKVYLILRSFVIACLILQLVRKEYEAVFTCILALVLLFLPIVIQARFKFELPNVFEIIIFFFIISGTILGEIYNFYGNIPHFDTLLHTINGFLCAGVGFALVDLFNKSSKKIKLSPLYVVLVAFCFSMTVGVCWELFEYGVDKILLKDMQKDEIITTISTVKLDPLQDNNPVIIDNIAKTILYDNKGNILTTIEGGYLDVGKNDTMKDLMVNLIGALTFSTLGYFYITNRDKYKFTENFIPKRKVI